MTRPRRNGIWRRRGLRRLVGGTAALALFSGAVLAQAGFEFMPDGGRSLLMQTIEDTPEDLVEIASLSMDQDEWLAFLEERAADLDDTQKLTLSSYLMLNMPLEEPDALAALEPGDLAEALPRDGKDLAVRHCVYCHGFYTAYLGHDRDVNGWMVMFNSPFHTEIRMDRTQRLTFAYYSEFNLPMRIEDVPPDLRY